MDKFANKYYEDIEKIEAAFRKIMEQMGLDLTDDSLMDTPRRVAKMYVKELFYGMDENNYPKITTVENKFQYNQMLVETGIKVHSVCEHHFVPIIGKAHIAYIPKDKVLGLSKFNRIVDYFARRPQVQERLTNQITENLQKVLETEDVAVVIDAEHFCVKMRGIKDQGTITRTSSIRGKFMEIEPRQEFFNSIPRASDIYK